MVTYRDEGPAQSDEETAAIKVLAQNATHPASWIWNEELVSYVAPSNPPDSNRPYMWNESTRQWDAYSG